MLSCFFFLKKNIPYMDRHRCKKQQGTVNCLLEVSFVMVTESKDRTVANLILPTLNS